jgi:hypothetical protein
MRLAYSGVLLVLSEIVQSAVLLDGKDDGSVGAILERDELYCVNVDARQNASSLTGQEKGTDGST